MTKSVQMKNSVQVKKSISRVLVEAHLQKDGFTYHVTSFTLPYEEFKQAVRLTSDKVKERNDFLKNSKRELMRLVEQQYANRNINDLLIQFLVSHDIGQKLFEHQFRDLGFLLTINSINTDKINGIITTRAGLRVLRPITSVRPDLKVTCEELYDRLFDSGKRFYLFEA